MKEAITIFSAISFLVYGTGCFVSPHLVREFERYGFARQRTLIGLLQLCGALGLIAGFWLPLLGRASSGGLVLMMATAIVVRIRISDSFLKTTPALLYFGINLYITLFCYRAPSPWCPL